MNCPKSCNTYIIHEIHKLNKMIKNICCLKLIVYSIYLRFTKKIYDLINKDIKMNTYTNKLKNKLTNK